MAQTKEGALKIAAKKCGISLQEYLARIVLEKRCIRCKQWRLRTFYGADASRFDGLSARCVDCRREVKQIRNGGKKVRILRAPDRFQRQAARDTVRAAIKAGRLAEVESLPCFDCGRPARHYHHHLGYARVHRLDIIALCEKCHVRRHLVPVATLSSK